MLWKKGFYNDIIAIWYSKTSFGYGFILFSNKSILFPKNKYFRIFLKTIILLLKLFKNSKWVYFDLIVYHIIPMHVIEDAKLLDWPSLRYNERKECRFVQRSGCMAVLQGPKDTLIYLSYTLCNWVLPLGNFS